MGLAEAVDKYNIEYGVSFTSYAMPAIVNAIKKNLNLIKPQRTIGPKSVMEKNQETKNEKMRREMKKARCIREEFFPTTTFVPLAKGEPYVDDYYLAYDSEYNVYITNELLNTLTQKQREVVELHLGIGQFSALPLESIASSLGKSGQAVDKLYKTAIERMRTHYHRIVA